MGVASQSAVVILYKPNVVPTARKKFARASQTHFSSDIPINLRDSGWRLEIKTSRMFPMQYDYAQSCLLY